MLTVEQLRDHVAQLSYRPGWVIEVREGRWEGPHVVITAMVEDANRPGEPTQLDVHSSLPPVRTVEELWRWLAWRLGRIELHEMREWLRLGGRPIYDPHGPYADRDEEV